MEQCTVVRALGQLAPVPPSVSPMRPGFNARQYRRGPQWPVVAWLFGWAFGHGGNQGRARALRDAGLKLTGDGAFRRILRAVHR